MTKSDKDIVIVDLSARIPYDTWVQIETYIDHRDRGNYLRTVETSDILLDGYTLDGYNDRDVRSIKAYLRPMSSMSEEEREDFWWNVLGMDWREDLDVDEEMEIVPFPFVENGCGFSLDNFYLQNSFAVIDWLNAHHFDYRGLIPKGLALEAKEGMYSN